MSLVTYFAIAVVTLLVYLHFSNKKKKPNLPGPWGIPILGSALQIEPRFHTVFLKWAKKYGDMFYVELGKTKFVVISDTKLVKEVFAQEVFTGRMTFTEFAIYEESPAFGLVNSEGPRWEQLRRFTLRQLRDFGFGKSSMETLIMEEVNEFNESLKATDGKPVANLKERLSLAVVNALWSIVSGERYSQDDPKLRALLKNFTELRKKSLCKSFDEIQNSGGLLFFIPWIKHIIPVLSGYTAVRAVMMGMKEFVMKAVVSHKTSFNEDESPRDFIDVFMREIRSSTDSNSAFFQNIGEKNLVESIGDLFGAGSDTSSTTLSWAILYLAKWQEVQRKFQEEIKSVTGNNRPVSVTDKPNMPYAQALIDEILRLSSIVALGVPHKALADAEIRGVKIPKNTLVVANLYYIHHDPKIWGDPYNFRPERFLTDDGKTFKKNENVLAFVTGKRACLGETLARDTIFLFLTNTFQQWNISFDPSEPEPPIEPKPGALVNPEDYRIIAKKL